MTTKLKTSLIISLDDQLFEVHEVTDESVNGFWLDNNQSGSIPLSDLEPLDPEEALVIQALLEALEPNKS